MGNKKKDPRHRKVTWKEYVKQEDAFKHEFEETILDKKYFSK